MNKEDWKCCDCKKKDAYSHEELWSFTGYGNNPYMKEDALLKNERCKACFDKKCKEFEEMAKN